MSIYDWLSRVDQFEEKYGNREAVLRACDLMSQYIEALSVPLPQVVAAGLRTALSFKRSEACSPDLGESEKLLSNFLKERSALTNYTNPEYALAHAVRATLVCYHNPQSPGGASELLSNFLASTELVKSDEELFGRLLKQVFST
jgi:hypothetical protein